MGRRGAVLQQNAVTERSELRLEYSQMLESCRCAKVARLLQEAKRDEVRVCRVIIKRAPAVASCRGGLRRQPCEECV